MDYIKVEGHDGLVRDPLSGAILNTNKGDYENYMQARNIAISRENEISRHAEEINNIKQDVSDIKEMLLKLLANKG